MKPIYFSDKKDASGTETRFWEYSQNNSGGSFDYNPSQGIGHYVIVEAHSADDADHRAQAIGLYFDGYGDCSCCGDRWSHAYGKGSADPEHYGEVLEMAEDDMRFDSPEDKPYIFVHYIDGRVIGWA